MKRLETGVFNMEITCFKKVKYQRVSVDII